jgi:tetratricopeptide (TPR) repeat protein
MASVAVAIVATRIGVASPADPCRSAGELPPGVWSPPRAAEVTAVLARHGGGEERVVAAVERWRGRWSSMRIEACRASKVRGTESAELLDMRMACLSRDAGRVDARLAALTASDGTSVGQLTAALASPDGLDACAGGREMLEPWRPPTDPARRDLAARLAADLATAEAAILADRIHDGVAAAEATAAAAATAELPSLRAEALLAVARGETAAGFHPAALATYRRAAEAAEAAGHEAVRVATLLGEADASYNLDRDGDATHQVRIAAAVAARLADPHLEARVAFMEALMQGRQGNLDAALAAADRGLVLRARLGERDSLATAQLQKLRAKLLDGLGRHPEADAESRASLATALTVLGGGHPGLAGYLVALSDLEASRGHTSAALAYAGAAVGVIGDDHAVDADHPIMTLAELLSWVGRGEAALQMLDTAITRFHDPASGFTLTARMHLARGRILWHLDRNQSAAEAFERAATLIEVARSSDSPQLAHALESLGHVYLELGRAPDALAVARRAHAIRRRHVAADHPFMFNAEALLGRVYEDLDRPAEAVPHLEAALRVPRDPLAEAAIQWSLGQALVASGGDRRRAVELVRTARARFAAMPEVNFDLAPLDRWLSAHTRRRSARRAR